MPLFLAHRGASNLAPENTLAAFRLARELGADGTELDVQRCASGEVVVFHDETLDRTTSMGGENCRVLDVNWQALSQLDAGGWKEEKFRGERIPLLEEVLQLCSEDEFVIIEVKAREFRSFGIEQEIVHALKKVGRSRNTLVASFNPLVLLRLRKIQKDIPIGLISEVKPSWQRLLPFWNQWIQPDYLMLEQRSGLPQMIRRAHGRNQKVLVWTLDEEREIQKALAAGADGIISNRPELFQKIRDRKKVPGTLFGYPDKI